MNRTLKIMLLIVCSAALIWTGFIRESKLMVMQHGSLTLIHRYPKPPTGDYGMQLKGIVHFNPSPKLQSSILFGLFFTFFGTAIIGLLTESKKITLFIAALYCGLLFACLLLLQLGALGVNYHLSIGLSHYLEDIVLSPFMVMVLIVLMQLNGSIKR